MLVKGIHLGIYLEGVSEAKDGRNFTPGYEAVIETAKEADLVVTELMPTPPYHGFTEVSSYTLNSSLFMNVSRSAFPKRYIVILNFCLLII